MARSSVAQVASAVSLAFGVACLTVGCGVAPVEESSEESVAEAPQEIGTLRQRFVRSHHQHLTRLAAEEANGLDSGIAFPTDMETSDGFCNTSMNPLIRGNCQTDVPEGSPLESYYGGDIYSGTEFQHLHFVRDYANRSKLERIASAEETCFHARSRIVDATSMARDYYAASLEEDAFYWAGHALHTIQDGISSRHTVRTSSSGYHAATNVCIWDLLYTPASICDHDSTGSDQAFRSDCEVGTRECLTPFGLAAEKASVGYLQALATILTTNADLQTTLNVYFDATDTYSGYFSCAGLSSDPLPYNEALADVTVAVGWTHFMPFTKANVQYLLAYNTSSGAVAFYRIDGTTGAVSQVWSWTWTSGWSNFMPFTVSGEPYFLSYKNGTGQVTLDRVKDSLQGTETKWSGNRGTGWSHFVPYTNPLRYVAYKTATGETRADNVLTSGSGLALPNPIQNTWPSETLPIGFRQLHPLVLGSTRYLFAHDDTSGNVKMYSVATSGDPTQVWSSHWHAGWGLTVPVTSEGAPHLLSYRPDNGTAAIDEFVAGGQGTAELRRGAWSTGWTAYVPLTLAGSSAFASYKSATGRLAIDYMR